MAPFMPKLAKLKDFAEVGQISELAKNKDKITQMGQLQKIQLERAEKLGIKSVQIFTKLRRCVLLMPTSGPWVDLF